MEKEININLEEDMVKGNVLDIGYNNYGVIYNLCKNYEDEIAIDYISGKEDKESIQENFYDSCIMLFSLNSVWLNINKKVLLKDVCKYLKKDGYIHVFDIDKGYGRIFKKKINIELPNGNVKEIMVRDLNLFKNSSMQTLVKVIEQYFKIIDLKYNNNIYYIKAVMK